MNQPFPFETIVQASSPVYGMFLAAMPILFFLWIGWQPAHWLFCWAISMARKLITGKSQYVEFYYPGHPAANYRIALGHSPACICGSIMDSSVLEKIINPLGCMLRWYLARKPEDSGYKRMVSNSTGGSSIGEAGFMLTVPVVFGSPKMDAFWQEQDGKGDVKWNRLSKPIRKSTGTPLPFASDVTLRISYL